MTADIPPLDPRSNGLLWLVAGLVVLLLVLGLRLRAGAKARRDQHR